LCWELERELDVARQNELTKKAGLRLTGEVLYIPLASFGRGHYWWPWLKNYHGEKTNGDREMYDVLSYVWVDQDLKKRMGY
jgi:peptide/nickel transport system substrate-binding protein